MKSDIFLVGSGLTPFGEWWDKGISDLMNESIEAALESSKLDARDADAVRGALSRVRDQLDRVGSLDPRKVFSSGALARIPDLQPLHASGIPGSYRLRVGRHERL